MQSGRSSPSAGDIRVGPPCPRGRGGGSPRRCRGQADGQVLVIFVLSIFVLMGLCAIVIDVSWYWANTLRVQRAADAAALAGVVDLPNQPAVAVSTAATAAGQNGYLGLTSNCTGSKTPATVPGICAYPDPQNDRQLDVALSEPVNTFFMNLVGIHSLTATRTSKALFVLPVPMGSPENYYGNFGTVRDGSTFSYNSSKGKVTVGGNSTYTLTGPGTPCPNGVANCFLGTTIPNYPGNVAGQALSTRGFWATMDTEGAANVNGDAYQPFYDSPTNRPAKTCPAPGSACYDATDYYNYAIYMPPNTTGGYVYIFDPVFCATALNEGTADRWFGGSNKVSSWYELFDTKNTLYDLTDDQLLDTSGTEFRDIAASDSSMGGSGGSSCKQSTTPYNDGRDYHDAWYLLNPGKPLSGGLNGTVYRLHTTQSVPSGQSDTINQKNTNGEQSFAIFANDTQGTTTNGLLPEVYGLGEMQMFTPLSASGGTTNSTFYLAQVDAAYAGRTLEINLWDPGDTSPLAATLYVQKPTPTGWSDATFTYTAQTGTTGGANSKCNSNKNTKGTTSVQTSTGAATGLFNGCWLTLEVAIPGDYVAPQQGWWLIKYSMSGNGTSSDVTTWTADIKGNPVHLIVP